MDPLGSQLGVRIPRTIRISVRVLGKERGQCLGPKGVALIPWGRGYKQLFLNTWLPLEPTQDILDPT